jgi:hypothetical protein
MSSLQDFSSLVFTSLPTPLLKYNKNQGKLSHPFYWLTEIGRKNVCTLNGLALLHKFSTHCPEDKSYDPLLGRVCYIINVCLDRKQLPVQSVSSPATFTLPTLKEVYSYNELDITGMSFILFPLTSCFSFMPYKTFFCFRGC